MPLGSLTSEELDGKKRPHVSIPPKHHAWIHDYCKEKGIDFSKWIVLKIEDEMANDTRNPVEVQRRKVTKELETVTEHLRKMHDSESNPRLQRLIRIAATLINTNPAWPLGPYADLAEDWPEIRKRAVTDYRNGAKWAKDLGIENALEIDKACDWADDEETEPSHEGP